EARRLPTLKYVSTLLNPISQYMGQMLSSDYCDMIIQAWAPAIPNMMALENANAGDFDDAVKVEIMKGKMAGKYAPVPPQNNFVNPA
ncbi:15886_t:CDS:1, partial [Gigaspora margarita]